jgi:hypothetical protein
MRGYYDLSTVHGHPSVVQGLPECICPVYPFVQWCHVHGRLAWLEIFTRSPPAQGYSPCGACNSWHLAHRPTRAADEAPAATPTIACLLATAAGPLTAAAAPATHASVACGHARCSPLLGSAPAVVDGGSVSGVASPNPVRLPPYAVHNSATAAATSQATAAPAAPPPTPNCKATLTRGGRHRPSTPSGSFTSSIASALLKG